MVSFSYEFFDASDYGNEDILQKSHNNLQLTASLMALKNIFSGIEGVESIFECMINLEKGYRLIILNYILNVVDVDLEELDKIAVRTGVAEMPSLAERLETRGEQRGQTKRSQEVLIKQIHLKYGISESEKDFIRSVTDLDKLDKATEAILSEDNKEKLLSLLK